LVELLEMDKLLMDKEEVVEFYPAKYQEMEKR